MIIFDRNGRTGDIWHFVILCVVKDNNVFNNNASVIIQIIRFFIFEENS